MSVRQINWDKGSQDQQFVDNLGSYDDWHQKCIKLRRWQSEIKSERLTEPE